MRGLVLLVCAACACAQTPEDPAVTRARAGIEHLRQLVAAGAAPRAELERAEAAIADSQDAALLRRGFSTTDLGEADGAAAVAAAQRRLERRREGLAHAERLVAEGVASRVSLGAYLEELDLARKELDLAESRVRLAHQAVQMAESEKLLACGCESGAQPIAERYDGSGLFTPADLGRIENAFERRFAHSLPVSAMGETAVHRALGFDHRNRVDVALHPDQPEGVWLRQYLEQNHIPFFAFRQAVPGKATAAHIHIGPMSTRLAAGG